MSATFGIIGTDPFTDLTNDDYEDLIYRYIGNNWAITTPTELNKVSMFRTATQADMINEPFRGLRPYWIWVQHIRTVASRSRGAPAASTLGRAGHIGHQSTFAIHLFAFRMKSTLTFPELGQISREVARILWQYPVGSQFPIPGILHFDNFNMENIREVDNMGDAFAGVYEIITTWDAFYHKMSTI